MCYSLRFLVPLILLATPGVGPAQRAYTNIGRTPSQEEIQSLGVIVDPSGKNLPAGKGTAKEGAELYAKQCAACHGKSGEGGVADRLVMGSPGNPHHGPFTDQDRHPVSFFAYSTTVWDYMNGIIQETDIMDAQSLPKVRMPNRDGFVPAKPVWPPTPKKPSWY